MVALTIEIKAFLILLVVLNVQGHYVKRHIPQGRLNGAVMYSRLGKPFYGYWKIPYAKPPVGKLRFSAPQKAGKWEGIRDASKDDNVMCPQQNVGLMDSGKFIMKGTEDCLYLSVFTPLRNPTGHKKLPVLVGIHGGSFDHGSYSEYQPHFLMDKQIVMVIINYRVGPLGFLSMEDDVLPGNWGLKDQKKALEWVQENIGYFGGDPNSVTIFGESAGAASVHYHVVSPSCQGLFHRAISNSASVFSPWALGVGGENRKNTMKMAKLLHCPQHPTKALVTCLRSRPMKDIINQHTVFFEWFLDPMTPFKPVVEPFVPRDEAIIPEHPQRMLTTGNCSHVPWLTGINDAEGALRVAGIFNSSTRVKQLNDDFRHIAPISLLYRDRTNDVDAVSNRIRNFYFGKKPISAKTVHQTTDVWTDAWFFAGIDHSVRLHLTHIKAPTYMYYYTHMDAHSYSAKFGNKQIDFGASHVDELMNLFPQKQTFPGKKFNNKDEKFVDVFVEMWANFAIYGKPTPSHDWLYARWNPVKTDKLQHMHIGGDELRMRTDLLHNRRMFWRQLDLY